MLTKTNISHGANVEVMGSGYDIIQLYSDLTEHLLELGLPEEVLTVAFEAGCLSADKKKNFRECSFELTGKISDDIMEFLNRILKDKE
jgi:hypothetical protein